MVHLNQMSLGLLTFTFTIRGSLLAANNQNQRFYVKPVLPYVGATTLDTNYDFIVIGAGTAGMALGARLSEDPNVKVAVVESGTDFNLLGISRLYVNIPGADTLGCGSKKEDNAQDALDWGFVTQPQAGANNRAIRYARGKTMGGSSTRNFMIYQRPSKGALDSWANLTGDPSWNFNDRWTDFQKSVSFTPPKYELRQDYPQAQYNPQAFTQLSDATGAAQPNSPIQVSYPNTPQEFSKYMQLSMNEQGISTAQDFNCGNLMGVQYASTTINPQNTFRSSSRDFFEAARSRKNLVVYTRSTVTKILFDTSSQTPRAMGVTFRRNLEKKERSLYAAREVIVSAGAFQSPQLLMVSGIGPRDQLVANNIPVLVENPNVGQGMEDHVFFGPSYPVRSIHTSTEIAAHPDILARSYTNWTTRQLGPFTNNGADLLAFEKLSNQNLRALDAEVLSRYPSDWPHIEYLSSGGVTGDFSGLKAQNDLASRKSGGKNFATILAALVAPRSRGSVKIASSDATVLPLIDPAWLTDPVDQRMAITAFRRARQFFTAQSMQPIIDGEEYSPGPSVQSDAQILNWLRDNVMTVWHAACTCSMKTQEKGGVIDSQFRVYGVQGLRVVDASSFPSLPPGHPQSTIYMMAERAVDLIRHTWQS
ncbi:hypothetical protein O181_081241 [Austropuccinia psidii MF-1]|uniref:Glucose-methanol-choline oxidoreductase N-terminal domain-containing protein n=1 Tax=Austropuccinia psidii MF-1 TaxID=1389203 RepID=A0A9Q3IFR2_9BASI|nr:hypothetical protein [Austropuccinia psidii MF-1]